MSLAIVRDPETPANIDLARGVISQIESRALACRGWSQILAYTADWAHFTAWCDAHSVPPLPASPYIVGLYLGSMAIANKSTSTIGRRLAAVRFFHKQAKLPVPKSDELTQVLSGIRRKLGTAPTKRKAAARVDIIKTALDGIRAHSPKDIRDRAILALGFTGALRRSEIVALNCEDLEFCTEGVRVHIRRSKTDQTGRQITGPIQATRRSASCRTVKR